MKEILINIQREFKSNKNLVNDFAKFNYRNLESMLADLKPILFKYNCVITFNDDIVNVGNYNYIKSTATLYSIDKNESISTTAFAREDETKAGMSAGQMTGCGSSYSRKYALCGLCAVNEEKDLDSLDNRTKQQKPSVNNIPIVDNNLELSPEQVKGNFVGYAPKTTKQILQEFYLQKSQLPNTNLIELEKFVKYYSAKEFKGVMNCEQLFSKWLSRCIN